MMNTLLLVLFSFIVSFITYYSGFGLGTVLMPFFALFFPLTTAISLTAVIHLFHNLLKASLLFSSIHWKTVLQFGIPAILSALGGSILLGFITKLEPLYSYQLFDFTFSIEPIKLIIGILLIIFVIIKFFFQEPLFSNNRWALILTGIGSGFFGGLSGHQGAFRSMALINLPLNKNEFIATSGSLAFFVDFTRLIIYLYLGFIFENGYYNIYFSVFSALLAVVLAHQLLKKIAYLWINVLITFFLAVMSVLFITGLL